MYSPNCCPATYFPVAIFTATAVTTFVQICLGRGEELFTIIFYRLEPDLASSSEIGPATASTCFPSVDAAEPTPATLQLMPS
jgi:hypothetical protein